MKFVPYWKRDIKYYLKKAYLEERGMNLDLISNSIIEHFKFRYITENDKKLLNLVLKDNVSQEELDLFLKDWDIEEEGGHKALMLSNFMKVHSDLKYPQYIEPRLKGLLNYYRFRNITLMAHFKKICTKLKESGVNILIFKGGAMKYYRPEFPRFMGDIDILVRSKEEYEIAKNITEKLGYRATEYSHSVDLYEPNSDTGVMDIHHKLDMISEKETFIINDLFARAENKEVFNVNGIDVPCCEDMVFILLINLIKNLMRITSYASVLHSIIDCKYLTNLKSDFDWNIIKQNAIKTGTEDQIYLAIKFLNEFLPQKIPTMFENEFNEKSISYLYNEWFIKKLRKKSHSLQIKEIFQKFIKDLTYYMKFRPQYIMYKRKTISNNSKLAKIVLEKQHLVK